MEQYKRTFIFGAGFSKPAGMPLATELLSPLMERVPLDEMRSWLESMAERLAWLSGNGHQPGSPALNIEQLLHYAQFDVETYRLKQQLVPVGRGDGPGTPWGQAESVQVWLSYLEDALIDVICERDNASDLAPIMRWASIVNANDSVLTFNYDTLVERALTAESRPWNYGTGRKEDAGIPVFKLHGSIDWVVAHRKDPCPGLELVFDKANANQPDKDTGSIEDDSRLWRIPPDRLEKWIRGRDLQWVPKGARERTIGMAGLGPDKELHRIPGLGPVWANGMKALSEADLAIVVGFSMSDFDAMAQMQFAEVARARLRQSRPLPVMVVDPVVNGAVKERFQRVFRFVHFVEEPHETFKWSSVT
jgi:hypothetical protein